MLRTRVGYAGGNTPNPTYHDLERHVETVELDFDPTQVSYDELLEVFWTSHNATRREWSRQYASVIFVHDDEQRRAAEESKARFESSVGRKVHTTIEPYQAFHLAEDYHQKFRLRAHHDIAGEYRAIYPALGDFVDSTAVTRANGFLGGCGSCLQLEREIGSLGLSERGATELHDAVCRRR